MIFFKGMGDVFQISQEYLEESLGEGTTIRADEPMRFVLRAIVYSKASTS